MSEFDDDLIADALRGRAGGGDIGVDGALDAVIGRAAATRRRRAAVAGMGAMTSVVVVAALALAGRSPDVVRTPTDSGIPSDPATSVPVVIPDSSPISPPPATGPSPTSPATPSTPPPSTTATTATTAPGGTAPAGVPSPPPNTAPGNTAPGSTSPPNTSPPSNTAGSTNPPNTTPGSTAPPNTTPGSTAPPNTAPGTSEPDEPDDPSTPPFSGRVYSSAGGSITVSWNGTSLSLGAVNPAAGFTSSIEEQRSDRIRVRFEGSADWRIEVRADSRGVVTSSISS